MIIPLDKAYENSDIKLLYMNHHIKYMNSAVFNKLNPIRQ